MSRPAPGRPQAAAGSWLRYERIEPKSTPPATQLTAPHSERSTPKSSANDMQVLPHTPLRSAGSAPAPPETEHRVAREPSLKLLPWHLRQIFGVKSEPAQ